MDIRQQFIVAFFALLAAFLGDLIIKPFMGRLRREEDLLPVSPATKWLGYIERFIYVMAWFMKQYQFIGLWLGIKALGEWGYYKENPPEEEKNGRGHFTVFLVGSGLSLVIAFVFIWLAKLFIDNNVGISLTINLKNFSEIFYNFTVGLGAIIGASAGLQYIQEFLARKRVEATLRRLKSLFPIEAIKEGIIKLGKLETSNKVYILDTRSRLRHWIKSMPTLLDLEFDRDDIQVITKNELEDYKDGFSILTSGKTGD